MNLQIKSEIAGDVTILSPHGDVDLSAAPELRAVLSPILESDEPRLLVDLAGVSFMDSTGVGIMVNAFNRVHEKQGAIAFCAPTPRVHRVLQISGLLLKLPVYETCEAALTALETPSQGETVQPETSEATA